MSQIINVVGADLYDFGRFMKLRAVFVFLIGVLSPVFGFLTLPFLQFIATTDLETLETETFDLEDMGLIYPGITLLLGFLIFVFALVALIFLFKMLIRLNRAKATTQDQNLRLSLQLFIIALILPFILPFIVFFISSLVISTIFGIAVGICNLMAFRYYYQYIQSMENANDSSNELQKINNGIILITINVAISILINVLFLLQVFESLSIIDILGALVMVTLTFFAQFQIATGTMAIFSNFAGFAHRNRYESPRSYSNTSFEHSSNSYYGQSNPTMREPNPQVPSVSGASFGSSSLPEAKSSMRKCSMCDELMPIDAQFCSICGTKQS
jgi:hypothetical protein